MLATMMEKTLQRMTAQKKALYNHAFGMVVCKAE
jgi:hypothetical protein